MQAGRHASRSRAHHGRWQACIYFMLCAAFVPIAFYVTRNIVFMVRTCSGCMHACMRPVAPRATSSSWRAASSSSPPSLIWQVSRGFVMEDADMYDAEQDEPCQVLRTMPLLDGLRRRRHLLRPFP